MKNYIKKIIYKVFLSELQARLINLEKKFDFLIDVENQIRQINDIGESAQILDVNFSQLPEDFDDEVYLKLNPDVKKAGVDPKEHFLSHGIKEGRPWSYFPSAKVLTKDQNFLLDNYWKWIKTHDPEFKRGTQLSMLEETKSVKRTDIINEILSKKNDKTFYLEIGVRNLEDNFNLIKASNKYSVDPGLEVEVNEADFKFTSDEFFKLLSDGKLLKKGCKFDVIFIDGLHLAEQVDRDIENALNFIKDDGFIVLHDCNPPTEWHSRTSYGFHNTPAGGAWNGTVWKAFLKRRFDKSLNTCCIDADWGVGIISKHLDFGPPINPSNYFYEYEDFDKHRKKYLNLISYEKFLSSL